MNATYISERNIFVCPVCQEDLQYWTDYDVLICLKQCAGMVYNPDTGEKQGVLE